MSEPRSRIIEADVTVRMAQPEPLTVQARFRYDPTDPYAVHVTFHTEPDPQTTTWTFARELLATGIDQPAGLGDVRIWPSPWLTPLGDRVNLALASPDGEAQLDLPRAALHRFLRRTYVIVPRGQETDHQDLDAALNHLLDR